MNNQNNYGQPIYYHQASSITPLPNQQQPRHLLAHPLPLQQAYVNNAVLSSPNQIHFLQSALSQTNPYAVHQEILRPSYIYQQQIYRPYGGIFPLPLTIAQQTYVHNNYNRPSTQFIARNTEPNCTNQTKPSRPVVTTGSSDMKDLLEKLEDKKKSQVLPKPPDEPSSSSPPPPLPEDENSDNTASTSSKMLEDETDKHTTVTDEPSSTDKQVDTEDIYPSKIEDPRYKNNSEKGTSNSEKSQEETEDTLYEISLTTSENESHSADYKSSATISEARSGSGVPSKRKQKPIELYGHHHKRRKSLGSVPSLTQTNNNSSTVDVKNDNASKKKKKSKKRQR